MVKIGDRIATLRKQKKMSQTELAGLINGSKEAIGKYERNETVPSVEVAKKIADVFEVTIDYLVNDNTLPSFDKEMVERFKSIDKLKPKDKEHLFALMDAFLVKNNIQQQFSK
jgi:transcriptional regulator with XRE-family HTH domain